MKIYGFSLVLMLAGVTVAQTTTLRGVVKNQLGGAVAGASVTVMSSSNARLETTSDSNGRFSFRGLKAGNWRLRVEKQGFSIFESQIDAESIAEIIVELQIEIKREQVDIEMSETRPNVNPDANKDGQFLKENEIEALPDDPDALEAVLRSMAGSAAGPDGGEIFVDGFLTRTLPPKSSIREIRINRNPFSAEFDRLGYGRIEIITKVGSATLQGSAFLSFSDEILNARDPFFSSKSPFHLRRFGGSLSDSFLKKKASYFLDIERRDIVDSSVINATTLDSKLTVVPFNAAVEAPQGMTNLNARTDFQIDSNNTLTSRYLWSSTLRKNLNVGGISLQPQAVQQSINRHSLQFVQSSVLTEKLVNEVRFQYEHLTNQLRGEKLEPTIVVSEAFISGNAQNGRSLAIENRFEVANNITLAHANHTLRAGGRIRSNRIRDTADNNFLGTLTYAGGLGPVLNANGEIVIDSSGQPLVGPISSIERYRRTLFFGRLGFSASVIRQLGGGLSQFSISGGDPSVTLNQFELSGFVQDEWRVRPNLSVGLGLRFETQTNIGKNLDLAPRVSVAYSREFGKKKKILTVFRLGGGLFYSRIGENLTLQPRRYDGQRVKLYVITDANVLDSFDGVPRIDDLSASQPFAVRQIADDIRSPRALQIAFSIEQELPFGGNLTATYSDLRVWNHLRSRNVNAFFPSLGGRPRPELGDIYRIESSGRFENRRLRLLVSRRFKQGGFDFRYDIQSARSDSDGASSFPADQFDLSNEFGRASTDYRHSLMFTADLTLRFGLRLSSMIIATSGRPFNITLGRDLNQDALFTDRPGLADGTIGREILVTKFGSFDVAPSDASRRIPRNFGRTEPYITSSLSLSKQFTFNLRSNKGQPPTANLRKRFSLTPALQVWNVFNNANDLNLVGNLASPFFGAPVSTAGGYSRGDPLSGPRTIELRARFSF